MILVNCDIYHFIKLSKNKKVICFGAGQGLKNFIASYPELKLDKLIYKICDNSNQKIGTNFIYGESAIPIIGINELCQLKDVIIVISCLATVEVYEQLEQCMQLKDTYCLVTRYILSETNLVKEKNRKYPQKYKLTQEELIPKKIHYCWFGKNPIPEQNRKWMESWRKFCPDYEIIEWNEDNYDITKNQYMYEAYKAKKWGFVPDYARLDIIYEHGGIYLDTDVEIVKNIDELLYQSAFAGVDSSHLVSLGLGFGAEKGNEFIRYLRDAYDNQYFVTKDGELNMIAAPTLQKEIFEAVGYESSGDYQIVKGMTIYPEKVLAPKCTITGRIMPTEHTFSIHHYDASWTSIEHRKIKEKDISFFNKYINNQK